MDRSGYPNNIYATKAYTWKTGASAMQKLLITGASGLLGNVTVKIAQEKCAVTPTDIVEMKHPNFVRIDIGDSERLCSLFQKLKPGIVIHTASETNVDRCETEREHAWKINALGTHNVAKASQKVGARLVYVSTDYVFDGQKGLYEEEDTPNPINFYGLTKLEGEKQALRNCNNTVVLRASVLYGRHPVKQDFATWVINKLGKREEITVVNDHFNSPTLAKNLAAMALEVAAGEFRGVLNTSGCERISRYDFAKKIAEMFDRDANLIKPLKMKDLDAWVAKRPRDSSLNTKKAQSMLRTKPLNINEGLSKLRKELEE